MELLPGIHLVDGVSSNVFVIAEPGGLTVIDTGMPGSGPKIVAFVESLGRRVSDVRRILLTHQHVDHVGGAAALVQATGAEVVAHPLDAPAIAGDAPRELPRNALVRGLFRMLMIPRLQPVAVTHLVDDGEILPVLAGEGGLRVVATPGHTRGQVAFYLPGQRVLFAGDAYIHLRGRVAPPPAMFTRDMAEARKSLAALAQLDVAASLPGHGAPITRDAGALLAQAITPA
ncbi:MAG TPA: MBL fold metallo-hydrolase [Ktedonobacterales bacterium]|jgi:glyoxylase-like metal-dependent hydrolase (beta-lactamase superfamily II)